VRSFLAVFFKMYGTLSGEMFRGFGLLVVGREIVGRLGAWDEAEFVGVGCCAEMLVFFHVFWFVSMGTGQWGFFLSSSV
jgi:hypothetical protein